MERLGISPPFVSSEPCEGPALDPFTGLNFRTEVAELRLLSLGKRGAHVPSLSDLQFDRFKIYF
jgi:hypothetical protein